MDIINKRFSRLLVVSFHENKNGNKYFLCKCDCGKEKIIFYGSLVRGATTSCGCMQKEIASKVNGRHWKSKTIEHLRWQGMIGRCYVKSHPSYPNYGGRGIEVDSDWLGEDGFVHFLRDMGKKPKGNYTIERKNNNKNYCKENCYWMLGELQPRNTRKNRWLEWNGRRMLLVDWAKELKVESQAISLRLKRGWTTEEALSTPYRKFTWHNQKRERRRLDRLTERITQPQG